VGINISAVPLAPIFPEGLVLANRGTFHGRNTKQLAGNHSILFCVFPWKLAWFLYTENMSRDGRAVFLHSKLYTLGILQGRNTCIRTIRFVLSIDGENKTCIVVEDDLSPHLIRGKVKNYPQFCFSNLFTQK
jgi:hypothetical protein